MQKGRICEKKLYNLYTFCAERRNAEDFGNLLQMLIEAIILAFQKMIYGQLEFTRIAWNLWNNLYGRSWPFTKLDALKQSYEEYGKQT